MSEYFVKAKYFAVDAVRVQYGETSRYTRGVQVCTRHPSFWIARHPPTMLPQATVELPITCTQTPRAHFRIARRTATYQRLLAGACGHL